MTSRQFRKKKSLLVPVCFLDGFHKSIASDDRFNNIVTTLFNLNLMWINTFKTLVLVTYIENYNELQGWRMINLIKQTLSPANIGSGH